MEMGVGLAEVDRSPKYLFISQMSKPQLGQAKASNLELTLVS